MYKFFGILLIVFSACQSTTSEPQVIPVFDKYMELDAQADRVKYGTSNYIKTQNILLNYQFGEYTKALTLFSKDYCAKPNKKVLDKFIEILIATEGSAFETPSTTLGEIYVCQSKSIIDKIKDLNKKEQQYIINSLDFGFKNVVYKKENSIKNYKKLYNQLKNLKKKI